MTSKDFKRMVGGASSSTIEKELKYAHKEVERLKSLRERELQFKRWCTYLVNGETMAGMFGCSPTHAMFVRQYHTKPVKHAGRAELVDVDLVIIPDVLVEHVLRVDIPDPTRPGVSTNTPEKVSVLGIVKRMQKHSRGAKNVSIGTFVNVMYEPCATCGKQALIVAVDEYVDDDYGYEFTVNRLCGTCKLGEKIACFIGESRDAIYRQ